MLRKTDCHAEAHAIAECAGRGLAVRGAACYVSKPPCGDCFSLLAVAGVSAIISPRPMAPKLCGAAKARGIAMRWVAAADEEDAHTRRRVVAEGQADMELVRALRLERRFTAWQRQRANLGRTVDRAEDEGSEAPPQLLVERDDERKNT
ncbi:hypothetical protein AB1Y20_007322 [Prymnesium parvum]|uniref:CMP/dCMP-type deaminase domain-containing protein n=1 Tax=Prymnesium parvum TaxID=97485 RepID=A0AB34IX53_PRYPA